MKRPHAELIRFVYYNRHFVISGRGWFQLWLGGHWYLRVWFV